MSANEFSHILRLDEIGGARELRVTANEEERATLAKRFGLISLDRLEAELTILHEGDDIHASGTILAEVQQSCIASSEAVRTEIREEVRIRFAPEIDHEGSHEPGAEFELGKDDCEIIFHDGKAIDIGEAVAQSLALALDPYPRSPKAEEILRNAGVKSEEQARQASGPFSALAALGSKELKGKE